MFLQWVRRIHSIHCLLHVPSLHHQLSRNSPFLACPLISNTFLRLQLELNSQKTLLKDQNLGSAALDLYTDKILGSIDFHPASPNSQKQQIIYNSWASIVIDMVLMLRVPSPYTSCSLPSPSWGYFSILFVETHGGTNGPGEMSRKIQRILVFQKDIIPQLALAGCPETMQDPT